MNNKTIATYSTIYKDYAKRNVLNPEMQKLLDKFIKLIKGKKILDVGCAQGRDSCYFVSKGYIVNGIDLTPEFIDLARINCPNAKFDLMDMRKLTFQPALFDGIWSCASFLHIPKKEALETLKGFYKVLKDDGVLFVSVMSGDFEGYRKHNLLKWGDRYFSHYQPEELKQLLSLAGFEVIELVSTPTSWGPKFLNFFCFRNPS